jgi:hypothetical protein
MLFSILTLPSILRNGLLIALKAVPDTGAAADTEASELRTEEATNGLGTAHPFSLGLGPQNESLQVIQSLAKHRPLPGKRH